MKPGQRRFALAIHNGASHTKAAILAGYSAATARQAGSRLAKHPVVVAELERLRREAPHKLPNDPRAFLLGIVGGTFDTALRLDAAAFLMPYFHRRYR